MPPLDRLTGLAQRSLPVIRRAAGWALTSARQVAGAARERVRESRAPSSLSPSTSNGAPPARATRSAPPAPPASPPSAATTAVAPGADTGHVDRGAVLVAESADAGAADGAGAEIHVAEAWAGYGEMTAVDIIDRLAVADAETLAVVRLYESLHRKRVTVIRETDRLLAATGG